jgi:hypothetical protein
MRQHPSRIDSKRPTLTLRTMCHAAQAPRPPHRQDGNAFTVLGCCLRAACRGLTKDSATRSPRKTRGDYDHLLATAMEHFDVQ